MLRACVNDFGDSRDIHLPLVEFSYTKSYHATNGMPPVEMLYGHRCRTPVCWGSIGQKKLGSLEVIEAAPEKLYKIKAFMRAAQDWQKSYVDRGRRPIVFEAGDQVVLKVLFRKAGLPDDLAGIHPTFHVSHLRKCLADEVVQVPLRVIELDNKLSYIEEYITILDRQEKRLRNEVASQVKV
ncbi:uncharacterized protein LOC143636673 [Bidens hawaiensis]|uniref:uncharacterized protein LOC143636673 n=1 Tax=Bidens hawaiensis TaxID=980011 RepID=UPI00404959A5